MSKSIWKGAIACGSILKDDEKQQQWKIVSFLSNGKMYEAELHDDMKKQKAVIIIEPSGNCTPSAQMKFYMDHADSTSIYRWKLKMKISHLGVQPLLGSGTHQCSDQKYRFIVLGGYGTDLWTLFKRNGRQFPEHTVYKIAWQILPVLEYIHSKGLVHGAIEGANLMLDSSNENVYLGNLGLSLQHINRKKILESRKYMSRDAHAGDLTARGDLESMFYNMIQWLGGTLPWEKILSNAPSVLKQKEDAFRNTEKFLTECFKPSDIPEAIRQFMQLLTSMESDYKSKYKGFSELLEKGLEDKLHRATTGKLELSVKSVEKSRPVIKSIKIILPKGVNTSEQSTSNAAHESAQLSQNPLAKAPAVPKEATCSIAEPPKKQDQCSMLFEQQVTKTDDGSAANTETNATYKFRPDISGNHTRTRESSVDDEKGKRLSKVTEKLKDVKGRSSETQKESESASSDIPNSHVPLDVDTSSRHHPLQSDTKAVKRKKKNANEVPLKRRLRSTKSTEKKTQQLHNSDITVDNAAPERRISPSSSQSSSLLASHNTPLLDAVNANNLAEVTCLLEKGASTCIRDSNGNTPLHLAFLMENNSIMDVLLSAMESTSTYENMKNKVGLTTLHIASTRNNSEVIKNLVESRSDLEDSVGDESLPWNGFTALHFAAQYRSVEAMKILAEASSKFKVDREKKNGNGDTALALINKQSEDLLFMSDLLSLDYKHTQYDNFSNFHLACARDDPETVKSFLEKGAPIDAPVYKVANICPWYAPLHFAVERRSAKNVKILVENGADLTRINHNRMTPLHRALYTEKNGKGTKLVDSLYEATRNKETNPKDRFNLSYFHVACTRDDKDLVRQFLDNNVDVNSKVSYRDRRFYNYTPLHFATLYDNAEVARLLIERGADVNACDDAHSGTPLHIAFDFGLEKLIKILLDNGANPNAITPLDKQTMLYRLVYGYVKVHENDDEAMLDYVERLIVEFGVDVNAKDHVGDTALHIACEQFIASKPVAKVLLQFGADINVENEQGETPFMWALKKMNNWHRDDAAELAMLFYHVEKLKAFGLEVNEKNERCCEKLIEERKAWKFDNLTYDEVKFVRKEILMEIEKMKKMELIRGLSLYDFVKLEPERYNEAAGLDFDVIASLVDDDEFSNYGYLVGLQVRKIRANMLNH